MIVLDDKLRLKMQSMTYDNRNSNTQHNSKQAIFYEDQEKPQTIRFKDESEPPKPLFDSFTQQVQDNRRFTNSLMRTQNMLFKPLDQVNIKNRDTIEDFFKRFNDDNIFQKKKVVSNGLNYSQNYNLHPNDVGQFKQSGYQTAMPKDRYIVSQSKCKLRYYKFRYKNTRDKDYKSGLKTSLSSVWSAKCEKACGKNTKYDTSGKKIR